MAIDRNTARALYETMVRIRRFEETAQAESLAGRLPGFMHVYIGEEAVATGVLAHLRETDYITSTHRGHGHCIAKGAELHRMMAELAGRETGLCRGRAGSMHMIDFSRGILGANGIVGAGLPLACGAGLKLRYRGEDGVCVAFVGDGGTNIGAFHESLNLASVWSLPVVFVVENNLYGEGTPLEFVTKVPDLRQRAEAYAMPGVVADGQDVVDTYEKAAPLVERARRGEGPSLLVCNTYRYGGHFVGDQGRYRPPEEVAEYERRDAIRRMRARCLSEGWLSEAELDAIDEAVRREVEEALAFARQGPWPEDVEAYVYVRLP